MQLQSQYKDYNEVTITFYFDKPYIVSNIHKKYLQNDNSHLQSLSIEMPSADPKDASNTGATGSISVVDYRNILFTNFISYASAQKNKPPEEQRVNIPIDIQIKCLTGNKTFYGEIIEWRLSFSGGPPAVDIKWGAYPIFITKNSIKGTYINPSGFIDAAMDQLNDKSRGSVSCIYIDQDGKEHSASEFDNLFEFKLSPNIGYVTFDEAKYNCNNGAIYAAMQFFVDSVTLKSDKNDTSLTYKYENTKFIITQYNPKANKNLDADIISNLMFVFNGSKPAYSTYDGKYIIPMTNFSYEVDNKSAVVAFGINENINGTTIYAAGQIPQQTNVENISVETATNREKSSERSGNIEISFDCYNVAAFSNNNTESKVCFRLFTEYGEEHPITQHSRFAMVKSIKYDLSGAVIKASVTATQVFNTEKDNAKIEIKSQPLNESIELNQDNSAT